MTTDERARAYATKACEKYGNEEQIFSDAYNEYIEIAEEQRKIDIDKACEWLRENLECYVGEGGWNIWDCDPEETAMDVVARDLRKAMEEEL